MKIYFSFFLIFIQFFCFGQDSFQSLKKHLEHKIIYSDFKKALNIIITDTIKSNFVLTLYPNLVKDVLHLKSEIEIDKIVVFDINGKKLIKKELNGDDKINVQFLVKGTYLIQFFTQNKAKTETFKLIKD